jgi:hypothetical protein
LLVELFDLVLFLFQGLLHAVGSQLQGVDLIGVRRYRGAYQITHI